LSCQPPNGLIRCDDAGLARSTFQNHLGTPPQESSCNLRGRAISLRHWESSVWEDCIVTGRRFRHRRRVDDQLVAGVPRSGSPIVSRRGPRVVATPHSGGARRPRIELDVRGTHRLSAPSPRRWQAIGRGFDYLFKTLGNWVSGDRGQPTRSMNGKRRLRRNDARLGYTGRQAVYSIMIRPASATREKKTPGRSCRQSGFGELHRRPNTPS